jgi:nucleotide-binding universal stress UspA family protein
MEECIRRLVILPIGDAWPAAATLHEAVSLAESAEADLELLAIVDSDATLALKAPSVGTSQGPPSHARSDEWAAARHREATQRLSRVSAQLRDSGFSGTIHCEVREGWPSDEIPAAANTGDAVAIVMPTTAGGDGSFSPELAQTVAERTDATVLLINELAA